MIFLREAAIAGLGIALIPVEIALSSVRAGQLVRVLPRHGRGRSAIYLMWPSQRLVPAPVVAAREALLEELPKIYR